MQCREHCIAVFIAFDSSEFVQRAAENDPSDSYPYDELYCIFGPKI